MDGDALKNVSHLLIDPKDYEIIQMIGNGSYGAVYLAKNKKDGKLYSMKYIQCQMMNHIQKQYLTREIGIMAEATHPALLSLRGFSLPSNDSTSIATIITDYMSKGSLFQMIQLEQSHAAPPEYNNTTKNIIIIGIAAGMKYLHHKKIMHRDLKPENILLNDALEPHIGDFGLSKLLDNPNKNGQANTISIGTPLYMAPEIFTNSPYDFKVDVYAFGMLLYEILTSISPFKDITNPMALGMKICNGERPSYPTNFSPVFQVLIDRCWASNPDHRPTFDEIVEYLYNPQVFVEGADMNKVNEYCQKVIVHFKKKSKKGHSSDHSENSDYDKLFQIIQNNSKTIESLKNEFQRATTQFNEETKKIQDEISELKKEESNVLSGFTSSFQSNQELLKKLTEEHKNLMFEMQKLRREVSHMDNSQQSPNYNSTYNTSPPTYVNSNQQQNHLRQQQQQQIRQQPQQQKLYQYSTNSAGSSAELNANLTPQSSSGSLHNSQNFRNQIGSNSNPNQSSNTTLNHSSNQNTQQNQNLNQKSSPNLNMNLSANSPGFKQNHTASSTQNYWNGSQPRT